MKPTLRAQALTKRATLNPGQASAAIAEIILSRLILPRTIAAVWPLPGELDLRPLLAELHQRGHHILLPQTPPRGNPLVFRAWSPTTPMLPERFGTAYPDGPIATPDLILVPLLAWDREGGRLGYGGGYYDRTLAALPNAQRTGFAWAAQQVEQVPMDAHDIRLPMVVTEAGIVPLQVASWVTSRGASRAASGHAPSLRY